jgi:hypothetical protein
MNMRGLLIVGLMLLLLVGVALWLSYRQQRTNGEVALSPERIEIQEEPTRPPLVARQRKLMIDGVHRGAGFDKPADPGQHGDPAADFSRLATTYHHPQSPLGVVLDRFNWFGGPVNTYRADNRLPAALVGLGADLCATPLPTALLVGAWSEPPLGMLFMGPGTLASYGRPLQTIDFYERNPRILDISTSRKVFTFVDDAMKRGVNVRILSGLERPTLANSGPRGFYHVLVVETSRGDPARLSTELLTVEAMQLLAETLAPRGMLCFHTSSRTFALGGVVAASAAECKMSSVEVMDNPRSVGGAERFGSVWVMVTRNADDLALVQARAKPGLTHTWNRLNPSHLWRDADRPNLGSIAHR